MFSILLLRRAAILTIPIMVHFQIFKDLNFFNFIPEPKTNTHGLELNKSTPFWIKTNIPLDGPRTGSLDLKDPTIVVLVPTKSMVEMS